MTPTFPYPMMPETMTTPRLRLRAPVGADASRIAMFIGDWDVAKMLARVPHPYREADATAWIGSVDRSTGATYVLVHANGVIGAVGIGPRADGVVELGYWLAKPFWGRGLVTEAAAAVINAARVCGPRAPITCCHFDDNPASGRVIQKLGFVATGEQQARCVARNAELRSLTYRLPQFIAEHAAAPASPPELAPA